MDSNAEGRTSSSSSSRSSSAINTNRRTISPSTRAWFNEVWSAAVGAPLPLLSRNFIPDAGRRLLERRPGTDQPAPGRSRFTALREEVETLVCGMQQEMARVQEYMEKCNNFLMPDPDQIYTVRVRRDGAWTGTPGLPALELSGWPSPARLETLEHLWRMEVDGDAAFRWSLHTLINKPECDLARLADLLGRIGTIGGRADQFGSRTISLIGTMLSHGYTATQVFELLSAGMDALPDQDGEHSSALRFAFFNMVTHISDERLLDLLRSTVLHLPEENFLRFWTMQFDNVSAPQSVQRWADALLQCTPAEQAAFVDRITTLLDGRPDEVADSDEDNLAQSLIAIVCIAGQRQRKASGSTELLESMRNYLTIEPAEHAQRVLDKQDALSKKLEAEAARQQAQTPAQRTAPAAQALPPFMVQCHPASEDELAQAPAAGVTTGRGPVGQLGLRHEAVPMRGPERPGPQGTATPEAPAAGPATQPPAAPSAAHKRIPSRPPRE